MKARINIFYDIWFDFNSFQPFEFDGTSFEEVIIDSRMAQVERKSSMGFLFFLGGGGGGGGGGGSSLGRVVT